MGTRTLCTMTVALVTVLSLVACSSSGGGSEASPNLIKNAGGGAHTAAAAGPTGIKDSKYFGLTTLSDSKLCSVLSASEASGILGAAASPGKFQNTLGLGITCEWQAGSDQLYVGVSTILDWKDAQAIVQLLKPTATTVDGHPALGANPGAHTTYADLDVAVGAAHDPAIEFRAPTLDAAKSFATVAMPRLIALA